MEWADSWKTQFELLADDARRRSGRQRIYLVEHELVIGDTNDQKEPLLHANNIKS
jgi:hypothetical protein